MPPIILRPQRGRIFDPVGVGTCFPGSRFPQVSPTDNDLYPLRGTRLPSLILPGSLLPGRPLIHSHSFPICNTANHNGIIMFVKLGSQDRDSGKCEQNHASHDGVGRGGGPGRRYQRIGSFVAQLAGSDAAKRIVQNLASQRSATLSLVLNA